MVLFYFINIMIYVPEHEFYADFHTWSILLRCQLLYDKIENRLWWPNGELISTYNFTSKSAFILLTRNTEIQARPQFYVKMKCVQFYVRPRNIMYRFLGQAKLFPNYSISRTPESTALFSLVHIRCSILHVIDKWILLLGSHVEIILNHKSKSESLLRNNLWTLSCCLFSG